MSREQTPAILGGDLNSKPQQHPIPEWLAYLSSQLDKGEQVMAESTDFESVAEPYRFNFEIAWEVANKGKHCKKQPAG